MKFLLTIFIYFFSIVICFSQKEATKWFFPIQNGFDFNNDSINFIDSGLIGINESSTSICDKNGNLEFYSNGITLYNKYHKIVKNGTGLGFPITQNESTSRQGALLLKHPNNDSIVYLFSTDYQGRNGGLVYAIINKKSNKDSGEVIKKKIMLISPTNEPINAVYHQNGKDIWIVSHSYGGSDFYLFLLTKNGILNCSIINNIGVNHEKGSGVGAQVNMKFSPNGELVVHHDLIWGNTETLKFNSEKGIISNSFNKVKLNNVFGIEFSPNSKFLYLQMTQDSGFYQINLEKNKKIKLTNFDQNKFPNQIQLAPNGKIYGASNNTKDIFVINNPNNEGNLCNINIKNNFLKYIALTTMPNFNQSYFYTPSINYSYEMDCINNSIQFEGYDTFSAITHQWQTKKLYSVNNYTSIGNTKNIAHPFADTGTYIVRYIADNGNRKDTVEKTITIYPKIKKDFLGKDTTIAQGSIFNIQLKSPQPSHCQEWYFERLNTQINKGSTNNITADSIGKYICKTTNQAFCEVTDTLIINECINNLTVPSIYRNLTDTLFTYQPLADSFVWYKNNQQITITKQPFIKLKDTGTYRVEAAKKGHCNRSSNTFYINKLGVKHYTLNDFNIKVYPNPSTGIINIESENQYKLKITDLIGRTILEIENQKQLELVKGVYYFMFDVDEYIITEKVIVL